MASLRDIRRKIGSVKNTRKITTAMKMVAAAKLRRAQDRVAAARPYFERLRGMLARVAPLVPAEVVAQHPLLQPREGSRIGLVMIASDRGLCGSYNNNVLRRTQAFVEEQTAAGRTVEIISLGRRGTRSLTTRTLKPAIAFDMLGVDAPFAEVQAVTEAVVGLYTRAVDPVSAVYIAYTEFINAVTQRALVERFLPIETALVAAEGEDETGEYSTVEYEFEPDAAQLLAVLIPRYVDNQVYQFLLEATASEYGARMTAMSQASDNAGEMIDSLTLQYNRARQDAITKEILDIVGGAEALRGE